MRNILFRSSFLSLGIAFSLLTIAVVHHDNRFAIAGGIFTLLAAALMSP